MFFIIKVENDNIVIVDNTLTKEEAIDNLKELALNFIKDEEGNNKAEKAFVDNVDEIYSKENGYYLLVSDETTVNVYLKKTNNGYLISGSVVEKMFYYFVTEYNIKRNLVTTEQQTEVSTIPAKPAPIPVNPIHGNYSTLLNELKEKLDDIREKISVDDDVFEESDFDDLEISDIEEDDIDTIELSDSN